jgi:hypothetical protein
VDIFIPLWIVQGIIAVAILLRDAWHRDWIRVAGIVLGLAIAVLLIVGGRLLPGKAFFFSFFVAPIVLAVAYGLGRRWVPFALALALVGSLALPFAAMLLPAGLAKYLGIFMIFLDLYFYFSPIVTVLACREVFACIGSYRSKERAA